MKSDAAEGPREILAGLAADEQDIRKKTEVLQKELEPKIKASEKARADAHARVEQLTAELAKMKAGYVETLATVEAEELERVKAQAVQLADVETGNVSMAEYYKSGQTAAQVAAEAKRAAEAKTLELLRLVRAKALEVIQAERAEAYADAELAYALMAPGLMWIQGLKEFTARAEREVQSILIGGWPVAKMKLDAKDQELAQAGDKGLADGLTFNSIDAAGLRDLKLDPRIPDAWLPQLDTAIASLGEGQVCDVRIKYTNPRRGIEVVGYETIRGMTTQELP